MRLRLKLAYDGACFRGWQSQPQGGSVQDVLQTAMTRLAGGERVSVCGAGRTDAGVHAFGQIAHADVPDDRGDSCYWMRTLNLMLPSGVRVMDCKRVREDFHARFQATSKTYEYEVWFGDVLPPHWVGRVWHVYQKVDREKIFEAARILQGKHDFRGFAANRRTPVENTVRHLRKVQVIGEWPALKLRFIGDGFLYKMVRMLVAAIVVVAQGKATLEDLQARLDGCDTMMPRDVAPPDGLYLVRVSYGRKTQSS